MRVDLTQSRDALEFLQSELQLTFPGGTTWVASRFDDGRLAGVVALTPLARGNTNFHVAAASPRWCTEEFLTLLFTFAFANPLCTRITASIEEGNLRCRRLVERVGFKQEGLLRGFEFGNLTMYGMLKGECKWAVL